jgi:hypothetical protein
LKKLFCDDKNLDAELVAELAAAAAVVVVAAAVVVGEDGEIGQSQLSQASVAGKVRCVVVEKVREQMCVEEKPLNMKVNVVNPSRLKTLINFF